MVPVPLLGGVTNVRVGGAHTRLASFLLWTFFELGVLALAAERSSQATCLATITSKPPKPMPISTSVDKGSEMRKEREVI